MYTTGRMTLARNGKGRCAIVPTVLSTVSALFIAACCLSPNISLFAVMVDKKKYFLQCEPSDKRTGERITPV